jgi:hypothetical protein
MSYGRFSFARPKRFIVFELATKERKDRKGLERLFVLFALFAANEKTSLPFVRCCAFLRLKNNRPP